MFFQDTHLTLFLIVFIVLYSISLCSQRVRLLTRCAGFDYHLSQRDSEVKLALVFLVTVTVTGSVHISLFGKVSRGVTFSQLYIWWQEVVSRDS